MLRAVVIVCLVGVIAGCSAGAEPILPTPRPSPTITPTLFTDTPTPAPPTSTRSPAPTLTPLPPPSETPILTPTFGPSPTPLLRTSSASGRLPTATRRVAQSGSLVIDYFTTDATNARPGDRIRVFWSVRGVESAIIYRLRADGSRDFTWTVPRAGSQIVTIGANDKDIARFVLTISDTFGRVEQGLTVTLNCVDIGWFFEPAPSACAAEPPIPTAAAIQTFERGIMLWLGSTRKIYVLFEDKNTKLPGWSVYDDTFKDGQPERDESLTPPQAMSQPVRGFGLVWRGQAQVKDRLGWAVDSEQGFNSIFQRDTSATIITYIQGRTGAVYRLESADGRNQWGIISGQPTTPQPTRTP